MKLQPGSIFTLFMTNDARGKHAVKEINRADTFLDPHRLLFCFGEGAGGRMSRVGANGKGHHDLENDLQC